MDMDEFRTGLRVLAVDDDRVSLMLIAKQLQLCKYNVTTVMHPDMALEMLRERKDDDDQFDLVITDVHMPEIDGFKLLELIGLEMDIPVIMLSANDTLAAMMKGIQHGARDYLVKPVRVEQLKRLCIHVARKVKNDPSNFINSSNDNDDGQSENGSNHTMKCSRKKKKDGDSAREDKENTSTQKRQRIRWRGELHRKFMRVINQIGIDKAVPKKILEMMNVEGLTREHVASHLQKYRVYMQKLGSSPFTDDETSWSEENSSNINGQKHFERSLEHGRYQLSLSFAGSSNSSNPFARMNSPAAFGTHSLLPTQSVQLMTQRNLGIPLKDMGPVGYGGNMPQIVIPESQPGLRNFTSTGNSNTNICFPSGPSGSSFANIPNGMPFNTRELFPSSTSSNSFANIPNGSSPLAASMEPRLSSFKSYGNLFYGKLEGVNGGIPNRLSSLAASSGQNSEFQNQMAALTMAGFNEQVAPFNIGSTTNSTPGGASSALSTFPNLQMNKPVMLSQMLNGRGEGGSLPENGGIVDQQAVGDQLSNNNAFLTATSTAQNGAIDDLDDFFGDLLNQEVLNNDDAFTDGDWEFQP